MPSVASHLRMKDWVQIIERLSKVRLMKALLQPCSSVDDANEAIVISEMSPSIEAGNGVGLCQQ